MGNTNNASTKAVKVQEKGKEDNSLSIFGNLADFESGQRMAVALSKSTIVPREYQNNPSNTLIALEIATRLKTSPMMVMQNLYIVNGRPSWSSQFIIAAINNSNKFAKPLHFNVEGEGDKLSCYCSTVDYDGNEVKGPVIDMEMAKKEGWISKNGSKWQTMPEVMIRYRAASFFGRLHCSDILMGIYSEEETIDITKAIDAEYEVKEEIKEKANKKHIDIKKPEEQAKNKDSKEESNDVIDVKHEDVKNSKDEDIPRPDEMEGPGF